MFFKKFFPKTIAVAPKVEPKFQERVKTIKELELEEFLGKPVICLSNEIQNLTVGIGKEITFLTQAQQPFLVVEDIVNKTEILPMGIIFAYTKQKFDALNQIEPNARIALFYNRLEDYEVNKEATQVEEILPTHEWARKVQMALNEIKG
jgi:hypothetical protein